MSFVWDETDLPEDKEQEESLPDGFIRTRYWMSDDANEVFQALRDLRAAVFQAGGASEPAAASPATGTFAAGDIQWNLTPENGGPGGWMCIEAGTPGVWTPFARLDGQEPVQKSFLYEGETLKLTGTTQSYIGLYPDDDVVRGMLGFTGYSGIDEEEDPLDYAELLYIRNEHPENGHIVLEPGLDGEVYVGHFTTGGSGGIATFGPTRFLAGGNGNFIDATAERIRLPRGVEAPTTGTYEVGDLFFNTASPGTNVGWVCTVAGTPGTWTAFGPTPAASSFNGGTITGGITSTTSGNGYRQTNGGIDYSSFVGLGFAWMGSISNHPFAFYTNNGNAQAILETNGAMSIGYTAAQSPASPVKLKVNGQVESTTGFKITSATFGILWPSGDTHTTGSAAPVAGTWRQGDIVWNDTPAAAGTLAWVCTTAGTPGTWSAVGISGGGGVSDHNLLDGLADDDHLQYALADGTRGDFAATDHNHQDDYQPLDDQLTSIVALEGPGYLYKNSDGTWEIGSGTEEGGIPHSMLSGLSANDHPQYALLAGATFTGATTIKYPGATLFITSRDTSLNEVETARIRLLESAPNTPDGFRGGYVHYNGSTNKLVIGVHDTADILTASDLPAMTITRATAVVDFAVAPTVAGVAFGGGVTDHGALTGLGDDDHTQYALADGSRGTFAAVGHNHDSVYAALAHNHDASYQPLDGDLTSIAAISSNGYLKRTGANTWATDTPDHGALGGLSDDDHTQYLLASGTRSVTGQFTSTVATGTAPFVVASTTKVTNLNADLLDGLSSADFAAVGHDHAATYQPLDSDLTAIAALSANGFLTKAAGTWVMDTSTYLTTAAAAAAYQPLDADLTALAGITGAGDGYAKRTAGAWSIDAGGGGGVTDHGALTGLADDDHTQYFLADGTRVAAKLDLSGAINRSTAAVLAIGDATTTGVNIGRSGQPNTITGSQTTFVGTAGSYPWRLSDGTRIISAWVGTTSGLECEFGTESNHALSIYTNNGTPQWKFQTGGNFEFRTADRGVIFSTGSAICSKSAAPTTGTWPVGTVVFNSAPSYGGPVGWHCTTGGTPGTWRAIGHVHEELTGTATWNPASLAAGSSVSVDVTVTGAALGDYVIACGHPGINVASILLGGVVRATNTVSVTMENRSGSAFDLASGTLSVIVRKAT